MTLVESEASFAARARDLGISDVSLNALGLQGIKCYSAFAFLVPYNPAVLDDAPLIAALTVILGAAPGLIDLGRYRRLQFEAYTLFLADTRARIERSEDSVPRRMPAPERSARMEAQKLRLAALDLTGSNEPSHAVIDIAQQMVEDTQIKYITIEKSTCRSQELIESTKNLPADISSDYLVRQCFLRRALAFDQSQIISFSTHEKWTNTLFEQMQRVPPPGYCRLSLQQALAADKQMFVLLGEECRTGVAMLATGVRPVDDAMLLLMNSARIQFLLLPLPGVDNHGKRKFDGGEAKDVERPNTKGNKGNRSKGSGKGDNPKGKGKSKTMKPPSAPFPDELKDCWKSVWGKRPCTDFNLGGCSLCNPGETCAKGVHRCCRPRCGELHSARSCSKR
jgi:hypothetical protein